MRRGLAILIGTFFTSVAAPVCAQTAVESSAWGTGIQPIPGLYSVRQLPNSQPTAPTEPVSTQPAQATQAITPPGSTQAPGTAWGSGMLYAGGTLGVFYDDNVFASHTGAKPDTALVARPELSWIKQGPNYTFTVDGFVEGRDYTQFSSENQINGSVGAGFKLMPDNDTQIVGSARYIHGHLDRGSSDTIVALPGGGAALLDSQFASPVSYDEGIESLALNKRYGNWWSSVGAAGLEVQYQNPAIAGALPFGGTSVDLSYANGTIASVNGRVGYVIAPLTVCLPRSPAIHVIGG